MRTPGPRDAWLRHHHRYQGSGGGSEEIGYPVLIKAKAGGGGRGIRLVSSPDAFENAFYSASSEAQSAFGDGACYMEKYLNPVKHIEMQILCDQYGNVVCLGERECSVQRKNQKLIEESPSPAITQDTRQRMIQVAAKPLKQSAMWEPELSSFI